MYSYIVYIYFSYLLVIIQYVQGHSHVNTNAFTFTIANIHILIYV